MFSPYYSVLTGWYRELVILTLAAAVLGKHVKPQVLRLSGSDNLTVLTNSKVQVVVLSVFDCDWPLLNFAFDSWKQFSPIIFEENYSLKRWFQTLSIFIQNYIVLSHIILNKSVSKRFGAISTVLNFCKLTMLCSKRMNLLKVCQRRKRKKVETYCLIKIEKSPFMERMKLMWSQSKANLPDSCEVYFGWSDWAHRRKTVIIGGDNTLAL